MHLIYIPGAFLALFLCLLIITKKKRGKHDLLLATWLFLISIHISIFYLEGSNIKIPEFLIYINASFPLLQGPFLYLYTYLLLQNKKFRTLLWVHFLPFFIGFALLMLLGQSAFSILIVGVILSGTTYILLSLKNLGGLKKPKNKELQWLRIITIGLGAIWILFTLAGIINHVLELPHIQHEYISVAINIFVYSIGFLGLKEGYLLHEPKIKAQYNSSPLGHHDLGQIKQNLEKLMQEKQPFLNPTLNIKDLARELNVPSHHLSEVFSAYLQTSFNDYINQLRIEEVKKSLSKETLASKSLLGIALDCGFNSKATFNRAFKKHCGQTPSAYIKSINGSQLIK